MLTSATTGLLSGLVLIIAIGAQNAFVLRQGLARRHVGAVVAVCALSDLVLIAAGVAGIGAIVDKAPWVIDVVRWGGVAFLVWYGATTLLRARHPGTLEAARGDRLTLGAAVTRAVALTWLNPHVYLDTVLLLGSVANAADSRWWFAAGAGTASLVWFTGLGYGARLAHRRLSTPRSWQVLDVVIAVTMLAIALKLALGG